MTILRTASTLAALALALAAPPALAQDPAPPPTAETEAVELVEGRALVRFQADADQALRERAFTATGVELDRVMGLDDAYEVRFATTRDPRAVARELAAQPGVRWAEPDVYGTYLGVPTDHVAVNPLDPDIGDQWALATPGDPFKALDARRAWGITEGNPGVTVAVIDRGVNFDHPELAGAWAENPGESSPALRANGKDDDKNGYVDDWRGFDTGEWDSNAVDTGPQDEFFGHGMMAAGVIAARGDKEGISGVVRRDARLLAVKVSKGNGQFTAGRLADAIVYARRMGAQVASVSLTVGLATSSIGDAVKESPHMLIVAGAGNDGRDLDSWPSYPCETAGPNVICVTSHDADEGLSWFSNHGSEVDLAAPGTHIETLSFAGRIKQHGTSLSAPFVAGTAALLYGMNEWLPADQQVDVLRARGALLNGVDASPAIPDTFTGGRLDAFAALRALPLSRPALSPTEVTALTKETATVTAKINPRGINRTQIGVEYRRAGQPATTKDAWFVYDRTSLENVNGQVPLVLQGLQPGTAYEARYLARNPFGLNDASPWTRFVTVADLDGPGGVTNPPNPTHG
jgi:hypothetical protein